MAQYQFLLCTAMSRGVSLNHMMLCGIKTASAIVCLGHQSLIRFKASQLSRASIYKIP